MSVVFCCPGLKLWNIKTLQIFPKTGSNFLHDPTHLRNSPKGSFDLIYKCFYVINIKFDFR
jgi:hypothetical protein